MALTPSNTTTVSSSSHNKSVSADCAGGRAPQIVDRHCSYLLGEAFRDEEPPADAPNGDTHGQKEASPGNLWVR